MNNRCLRLDDINLKRHLINHGNREFGDVLGAIERLPWCGNDKVSRVAKRPIDTLLGIVEPTEEFDQIAVDRCVFGCFKYNRHRG